MRQLWMIARRAACLAALLAVAGSATALGADGQVQIDYADRTITYDLASVKVLRPGRFIVTSTMLSHPDVVQLELTVLDTLRSYCGKPPGNYDPPGEIFSLGPPDMPVKQIVVMEPYRMGRKDVLWRLPYLSLAADDVYGPLERSSHFGCYGPAVKSVDKEYDELKSLITDANVRKQLYDCRHGVMGLFIRANDPPSRAVISTKIRGQYLDAYRRLCPLVVGGSPHPPSS